MIWNDNEIDDFCNGKKENIFKIHEEQDIISNKIDKQSNNKYIGSTGKISDL